MDNNEEYDEEFSEEDGVGKRGGGWRKWVQKAEGQSESYLQLGLRMIAEARLTKEKVINWIIAKTGYNH